MLDAKYYKNILKISCLILVLALSSCKVYKQDIMLKTDKSSYKSFEGHVKAAEKNYKIRPNDFLELKVYSNGGELIIDPNFELRKEIRMQGTVMRETEPPRYLVQSDGVARLPMLGEVKVEGYTIFGLDSMLAVKYSEYYEQAFVMTKVANRRAIVFGPLGGQVVPLVNEKMNLLEVVALYGGIDQHSIVRNIRLIRGDLKDPYVQVIDLTTIDGLKAADLEILADDIIYIQPGRKFFIEGVRDVAPLISLFTSVITLAIIISRN